MWKSLRVFAKFKAFSQFMGATMLCLLSGYSIATESTSTCWVYGGTSGGQNVQMIYGLNELDGQSWPDPVSAFRAFEQFTASRLLGAQCVSVYPPSTISRIDKGHVRISRVTSGRVGDPQTGVTIGYSQAFIAFNQTGEYCSVSIVFEATDGSYWNFPQCKQSYIVKLSLLSGQPESGTILSSIEPDKSTGSFVAKVYDQNNQLVPNVAVQLTLEAKKNSGGHHHGDDTVAARTGTMQGQQVLTDNTKANGLQFSYKAPSVSGDYKIVASCTDGKNCKQEGPDTVWVGVKGLQPVGGNAVYRLIPNAAKDPGHPDNHYLTLTAASRLAVLATLYHARYPDLAVLHLNDASLERGGIFDLNHNWRSPHWEHCRGAVIDIRANGAEGALDITNPTDPMIKKFQALATVVSADAAWDVPKDKTKKRRWDLRHFHIRLLDQEGLQCP